MSGEFRLRFSLTPFAHMDRLPRRVRVVPKRHLEFPPDEYFQVRNKQGTTPRYDWLSWLGYVGHSWIVV